MLNNYNSTRKTQSNFIRIRKSGILKASNGAPLVDPRSYSASPTNRINDSVKNSIGDALAGINTDYSEDPNAGLYLLAKTLNKHDYSDDELTSLMSTMQGLGQLPQEGISSLHLKNLQSFIKDYTNAGSDADINTVYSNWQKQRIRNDFQGQDLTDEEIESMLGDYSNDFQLVSKFKDMYAPQVSAEDNIVKDFESENYNIPKYGYAEEVDLKSIEDAKKKTYGQAAEIANLAIGTGQAIAYGAGANSNDSRATTATRQGVETAAELADQLPPPAKMAAPILRAINLADSILDKAHVGQYNDDFKTDNYTMEELGSSGGGLAAKQREAEDLAGQRHGFLGLGGWKAKRKDNARIREANKEQHIAANIVDQTRDIKMGAEQMHDLNALNFNQQMHGGFNNQYLRVAKEGGELIENSIEPEEIIIDSDLDLDDFFETDWTKSFKEGGKLESPNGIESSQENIIPEGALHARKHNMSSIGFDDSKITKKGIPVINDSGQQQAEIELNEIIFTLEVTKFLEEEYQKYYNTESEETKNEIARKIGDELVFQILHNTDDRTDLIMAAKQGGVLVENLLDLDLVNNFFKIYYNGSQLDQ